MKSFFFKKQEKWKT